MLLYLPGALLCPIRLLFKFFPVCVCVCGRTHMGCAFVYAFDALMFMRFMYIPAQGGPCAVSFATPDK